MAACSADQDAGPASTATSPGLGAGAGGRSGPIDPPARLAVRTASTRADLVTGGDVLVEVDVPAGLEGDLVVTAAGRDVTAAFPRTGEVRRGLVTGLPPGSTAIEAQVGAAVADIEVTDHPLTGPVLSGPHLPLVACSTEAAGLGPATDADCSAPTVVDHLYVTTSGAVAPLPDAATRPPDLATAVIEGTRVPLVVRRERGVINRGVYTLTVVEPGAAPPAAGTDPASIPVDRASLAWNDRLVWRFGGGCGTTYTQGTDLAPAEDPALLARGYAVVSSSATTFQTHCNDVVAAETVMMVKEHVVEELGPVAATIGQGASGGAIQQHLIVQNYPGLLDAAAAGLPFPDALSISPGVTDCALLGRYYGTPAGAALDATQRKVINGHATAATCSAWDASFVDGIRPTAGCPEVPEDLRYHPDQRRTGIRCTLADGSRSLLGTDPASGFAVRPLDNVGVEYGRDAFDAGAITADQFLDLNAAIGGFDVDGGFSPARSVATPEAVATAYAGGRIASGGGDLRVIPLIDVDLYTDATGDIHDRFRAFSLRDRLRLPDGRAAPNHVIWTRRPGDPGHPPTPEVPVGGDVLTQAVVALDRWVTAIGDPPVNRAAAVAAARPPDVADECLGPDGTPIRGEGVMAPEGPCGAAFPLHGDPRTAAGAPRADDVLKCALVPPDPEAYVHPLTGEQALRLEQVFPAGVCDWAERGTGTVDLYGTWLSYAEGLPFDPAQLLVLETRRTDTGRDAGAG